MLFQGNELAITQGGRSAQKVSFWIADSSHTDGVWKWPLKELHMVMNEANALGMPSIKYSQPWGGKRSRQAREVPDVQQIVSDDHHTPLRDTSEVQMNPCPAKPRCTELQMDERTSAEGCRYLLPGSAAHAFKGSSPQQEAITELDRATWGCAAKAAEGEQDTFQVQLCCWRIQTTAQGSCDNSVLS